MPAIRRIGAVQDSLGTWYQDLLVLVRLLSNRSGCWQSIVLYAIDSFNQFYAVMVREWALVTLPILLHTSACVY